MLDGVSSLIKKVASKITAGSSDAIDTHHHTVGAAAFPNLTSPYVTRAWPPPTLSALHPTCPAIRTAIRTSPGPRNPPETP